MADQIQWDEKPDTSGLVSPSKIQWDEKPNTSELTAEKDKTLIPENYGFTLENLEHSGAEGVKNILGAVSEMGKDLISRKTPVLISDEPGTISERMQGDTLINKYVLAPAKAEEQKAQTAKTPWESIGHSVAEAIPVIGPIAAHIGERAGTGDVGGALAEGATYAVVPKVAEKALPVIRGTRDFTRGFVKGAFAETPAKPAPLIPEPTAASPEKATGMPKIAQESPLAKYKAEPEPTLANEGRSPEDLSKVDRAVFQLSNKELRSLGNRFGLDESKYDFSKREAAREGGTKHAVERDQFSKDLQAKLPADLVNHIVDTANAWDAKDANVFDPASMNSKFGADRSQAIIQEAMKRWQPRTEAEPLIKGGGARVKSPSDFSSLSKRLMQSLQISPEKVLDELEGTDSQIQARLLKASTEDLARWAK